MPLFVIIELYYMGMKIKTSRINLQGTFLSYWTFNQWFKIQKTLERQASMWFNLFMNIILDTNILIALEDHLIIETEYSIFYQNAIVNKCQLYIHPDSSKDILRDKSPVRREIILSKLNKYAPFPSPAPLTEDFIKEVGQKNENDRIDNQLLIQIEKGYAALLVTEDKKLLAKAERIECRDKVLSLKESLEYIKSKFTDSSPHHPNLLKGTVREFDDYLTKPFFDSLRKAYPDFNKWMKKCLQENRECYYIKWKRKLAALLIFNVESAEQHRLPDIQDTALKMCTFKTSEDLFGLKLGELFLSKMFQFCIEKGIGYLHLSLFDNEHLPLVGLLTRFGFTKKPKSNGETSWIKIMKADGVDVNTLNRRKGHPFYSDSPAINKFVIPIQPEFYDTLFKDSPLRQPGLFDKQPDGLGQTEGNAIVKAYICSANNTTLKRGDILFFYLSQKNQAIQPVGILEKCVTKVDSFEKLQNLVRGKTVFKDTVLKKIYDRSKPRVTVLTFRLNYYLKKQVELDVISTLKCYSAKFTTITKMPEQDYQKLKKEKYFDERYLVN